ncbi:alcohol dehydrogenase, partial [candidate division KSB1 bacterium]|nr:alcohol dehydrogenase [candidate division KSB1 bacterium]
MLNGYAALKVGNPLVNYQWDPGQLGAWEVEVKVTHCG